MASPCPGSTALNRWSRVSTKADGIYYWASFSFWNHFGVADAKKHGCMHSQFVMLPILCNLMFDTWSVNLWI